ncbi:prepilin peptidase [Comamonas sp. AG1104]|uniref:A24 family peptidase n=1 Tax=Comamonas sp. AG1104 TaxID=2183900 RepID=UPI000E0B0974|nr:A24 family peptidase [Comamonas sp. AG1104]
MGILFLLWMCYAAVYDALHRRCENWVIILGILLALASVSVFKDAHPVSISLGDSLLGFFTAFVVLLFFYSRNMMGAGDVKFAAVVGLWVGFDLLLPIWALSCFFAVLHGIFAKFRIVYFLSGSLVWGERNFVRNDRFIPYVTYMSVATVIILMFNK